MSQSLFEQDDIREIIDGINDVRQKIGFKYLYLIAGDVSEAWGKNSPSKKDMKKITFEINGESIPAIVFFVKKARSKNTIRVCSIPMEPKFEPWAEEVYNWFQDQEMEQPLIEDGKKKKIRTYYGEAHLLAKKIFQDFKWYRNIYYKDSQKIEYDEKEFTLMSLRDLRRNILRELYHFSNLDMAIFTGIKSYVSHNSFERKTYDDIMEHYSDLNNVESIIELTENYFSNLLIPSDDLYYASESPSLHIRNYTELDKRFTLASRISRHIQDINFAGNIKYKTPFFKENMELILQIINPCENKDDFTVKIANLASLFEINKKQLETLVLDSENKGTIKLIKQMLDEKNISYKNSLFKTWINIKNLRNLYPIHSRDDPNLYANLLRFFNTPVTAPPNYSELWDNILNSFANSLSDFLEILNEQLRIE